MFFFKNLTDGQRKLCAVLGFIAMIVFMLAMGSFSDKQKQDAPDGAASSEQVVAANEQATASDEQAAADKTQATGDKSADAAAAMTQSSEDQAK